jgi:Zn-dependent M28 family amino/carboxypeptidase
MAAKTVKLLLFVFLPLLFAGCTLSEDCSTLSDATEEQLLDCVKVDQVIDHLQALQAIAEENGGNRAADTNGYDASLAYVANTLEKAGYQVELHEFEFSYLPPAVLRQIKPVEKTYESGIVLGSGSGTVSGPVFPLQLTLDQGPRPDDASAACEASDFEGLDLSGASDIVLFDEGGCMLAKKVLNAQQAGAEAAILLIRDFPSYAQGGALADATKMMDGTPANLTIPIVATSADNGPDLARDGTAVLVEALARRLSTEYNLLAELPGAQEGQVVMAGAHLDSVRSAPGINDNGSGSAALLETAVQMAGLKPKNTVRFAWWGAEEYWLVGSLAYVNDLSEEELADIGLYINLDMIASPNHYYAIYDADDSDHVAYGPYPQGSAAIEKLFQTYYSAREMPYHGVDPDGRSDYQSFLIKDIPVGGIFTGAEEKKSARQAEIFGGTALEPYDPCYHLPCDDMDNVDREVLNTNADAVAYAVYRYAMTDLDSLASEPTVQ